MDVGARLWAKLDLMTVEESFEGGLTMLARGACLAGTGYGSALEAAILGYGRGGKRE